ncbi:MAG: hypothetical protein II297_04880 [Clostridia bacterium]|nr:hypothetical protein [Clostridia bacterium]
MGFLDEFFEEKTTKHDQAKQELMELSEKELLVEILLELRKINETTEDIYRYQLLNG